MSSTNKTTNYELSQFVGTDKPAWLSDYNADMGKIDTAIKAAKDEADSATGASSANTTAIGTLASLETTHKDNLVEAINEVKSDAGSATNTANSASDTASGADSKATTAKNTADAIITAFTLGADTIATLSGSNYSVGAGQIRSQLNTDGSIGRIYTSNLVVKETSAGTGDVDILTNITVKPQASQIFITMGKAFEGDGSIHDVRMIVETTGEVKFRINLPTNTNVDVFLPDSLKFFDSFDNIIADILNA